MSNRERHTRRAWWAVAIFAAVTGAATFAGCGGTDAVTGGGAIDGGQIILDGSKDGTIADSSVSSDGSA